MEMQGETVKRATCNKVANLVVFVGLWMHCTPVAGGFYNRILYYYVVDFSKLVSVLFSYLIQQKLAKGAKVNAFIDSLINVAQLRTIITHFDLLRHSGWLCQLQSLIRDLRAVISGFLNALTQFGAI